MPAWAIALLSAAVGALVGAIATAAAQYSFWKRQHRQEVKSQEDRETRREKARAAERLRETGVLLIELARTESQTFPANIVQVHAPAIFEIDRLRREFVNATYAAREVFPAQDRLLTALEKKAKFPLDKTEDALKMLREQLDDVLKKLREELET